MYNKVNNLKKKKRLTKEQILENKNRRAFKQEVKNIFLLSGFNLLPSYGKQFFLVGRNHEFDHIFIYKNIIIICEDTFRSEDDDVNALENHKMKKNESSQIIKENKKDFIECLKTQIPQFKDFDQFKSAEYKIFYLYFQQNLKKISEEDKVRYSHLIFVDMSTRTYFNIMARSIKCSFKYEIFRFLGLQQSDLELNSCNSNVKKIRTPIIYPDSVTGHKSGVRMVSFMMRPSDLLKNCYVLRKDGWETKSELYQRLITPKRIKAIRDYLEKTQTTFLNNVIVTLPPDIVFLKSTTDGSKETINVEDITNYQTDIEIEIPEDFNSMAIIDGQHRVYAYYEDTDKNNLQEKKISSLRDKLNLLVTGIIFPKTFDDLKKRQFESSLFLSINKNAKAVDADTLIQVLSIMNPTSGEALSRKVIEALNKCDPFKDKFQLSKVDKAPIKTASIIQFALSSLLTAKPNVNSMFYYWIKENKYQDDFRLEKQSDIDSYIKYCTKNLIIYFKAICSKFFNYWTNKSKLLMVVSINAFLIAYRETLPKVGGPQSQDFYASVFKPWTFSFEDLKDKPFQYASAQYSKFAKTEIIPLFDNINSSTEIRELELVS